ncbi:hypothetical protein [Croceicoccus marinus]|uniref:Uncharacterized protein n=1 Tax=Croceicoccus marinus TaxID=450378 RepID=A0A7G6VSH4_9SPHN|nr:hypothetical protein [Croceicoccus marinus]QNE04689.1 hypothetical protein H4O24_12090 [Croceicoccus marinus]QNE05422.1 hypothetical protein H4O24_01555 [Croceicoccus marinus]
MSKEHRYNSPTVRAIIDEAGDELEVLFRRKPPSRRTFGATVFVAILIGAHAFLFGLIMFR